jgi:hypothetical protein
MKMIRFLKALLVSLREALFGVRAKYRPEAPQKIAPRVDLNPFIESLKNKPLKNRSVV